MSIKVHASVLTGDAHWNFLVSGNGEITVQQFIDKGNASATVHIRLVPEQARRIARLLNETADAAETQSDVVDADEVAI